VTQPQNSDPNPRISPSTLARSGDVLRRENGIFISEGIPGDHVALAQSNMTELTRSTAERVAASARNTPLQVDQEFILSLQRPYPLDSKDA
jgi:hypothetical protein